jgi:hypothetical protein
MVEEIICEKKSYWEFNTDSTRIWKDFDLKLLTNIII